MADRGSLALDFLWLPPPLYLSPLLSFSISSRTLRLLLRPLCLDSQSRLPRGFLPLDYLASSCEFRPCVLLRISAFSARSSLSLRRLLSLTVRSSWEAFLCRGNPPPSVLCRWPSRVPCDPRLWLLAGFSLLFTAVVLLFAAFVFCSCCFLVHVGGLLVLVRSPTSLWCAPIAPFCGFLMLSRSALCRFSTSHGLSLSYRFHDFPSLPTHS